MATIGYASALGSIAKDAISGAGKGFVGGLKGAMMSEAPGLTGAYAFGKELRNRANAPRASDNKALSSGGSSNQSSNSAMGGSLSAGISTVAGQQKQSNVINLEQVRQLRQLNNNVINQSKLIAFQVNEAKRKELFAEELANEQALRDDKLLEAIRNIGGGGRGGAANNNGSQEGSGGGFLSGLVGSLVGGAGQAALTKLVPFLSATMAAIPWARILSLAGRAAGPVGTTLALSGSTPNKETQQKQDDFYRNKAIQEAQKRAAEEAKDEPRPLDRSPGNYRNNQRIWDEKYQGRKDPVSGKTLSGIYNIPASGKVSSTFGPRSSPGGVGSTDHMGVDIATILGSPVNSIAPGTVVGVDRDGGAPDAKGHKKGLGRYVVVDHGQGVVSKYAHLSEVSVNKGDKVGPGVILGKSGGNTEDPGSGASTGAHLHLEVTNNGTQIDPSSLGGLQALKTKDNEVKLGAAAGLPGTAAGLPGTGNATGATSEAAARKRRNDAQKEQALGIDYNAVTNYDGKFLIPAASKSEGGVGSFSAKGFGGGGGGGGNNSLYTFGKGPGGTGIKVKEEPIPVEDKTVKKAIDNVAKGLGVDPKSGTPLSTKKAEGNALQTKVLKPLFKSNTDIIKETNQAFLKQFKSTATSAINQGLTKALFPKGFGVSASTAGGDNNFRGQQLQKIFGTDKVITSATTKLLGKQYGPMFAPLFNNLAQGYLEVGSRIAGGKIFQTIGGLGAEETQTLTGQVLGNFAAGNKKLALEQLLYGASGGSKSGIALGPETLLAKYGFKNPAEGLAYFAGGLADMATAPLANLMGGDPTNGVSFDSRTGKYYNRDGTVATPAEYAAASRQYGASLNQGPLFSVGNDNYSGAGQPGTTQMQGGVVVQGYGQQYGPRPGQFRVVAPTVNTITGVTTAPTIAQATGLTPQQQAGLTKEQLELQQATYELAKIKAVNDAKAQGEILKANAETMAQGKTEAEAQALRDAAANQQNALVTDANARFIVSGLGGQKEGGGSATPGAETPGPGDPGYRSGQLFQNPTDGSKLGFGKEVGNFAFDMGKNMLGNQLTKGIKNPYAQMVANFAVQKGLNLGVDALMKSFSGPELLSGGVETSFLDTAGSWISNLFGFADGGVVTKSTPGIFGEAGAEAVIPLANPNATKALSAAMGTDKTLASLGDQTSLLTSIDGSLRAISGSGTGSGTGLSFDTGLAGLYGSGGTRMSSGGNTVNGVARSRATQQKPSAMDYATAIGTSLLKGYAIKTGINMASTALFGATPGVLAGDALISAGFPTLGGMLGGGTAFTGTTSTGLATLGGEGASTIAATGLAEPAVAAGAEALALAPEAFAMGPVGWTILAAVVLFSAYGGGGGGGSAPPPKEPKYHAGIYVAGNNNINAIAPILETVDYHAPPEGYKTVAYGLLRVAFNATKSSEAVTNMTASYDFIYMKVQFDKISMIVGKGAPNSSYTQDGATDTLSWPAPTESTNLNALAQDIITWVRDDFKKLAKAENLGKLDKAAEGLGTYTLNELSSGLIPDLKRGQFALDKSIEKGIYANSVAESDRIAQLITAASSKKAYTSEATSASYDSDNNLISEGTAGGVPMIYSLKEGKFIENKFPGALLVDTAGRPVYDIEGTSAGLSVDDFVSASVAGSTRLANVMDTTSSSGGATSNIVVGPTKTTVDNSAVTNYYTPTNGAIDIIRAPTPQVG